MWETLQNNADWNFFKTPILQEILRIQNLHQVEHCVFLEVIHLFQSAGCVRNKLQFRTAQQNHKSSLWMQDWSWTVYPRLTCGIWSLLFFTEIRIRVNKYRETCLHLKRERKFLERLMIWIMLILFPQTRILFVRKLCCTSCCLTESIWTPRFKSNTLTPRTNSQTCRPREISHVMSGTIFCVYSTVAISAPSTASKRCRKEHKKVQVKKETHQNQGRWWIWYRDAV